MHNAPVASQLHAVYSVCTFPLSSGLPEYEVAVIHRTAQFRYGKICDFAALTDARRKDQVWSLRTVFVVAGLRISQHCTVSAFLAVSWCDLVGLTCLSLRAHWILQAIRRGNLHDRADEDAGFVLVDSNVKNAQALAKGKVCCYRAGGTMSAYGCA